MEWMTAETLLSRSLQSIRILVSLSGLGLVILKFLLKFAIQEVGLRTTLMF